MRSWFTKYPIATALGLTTIYFLILAYPALDNPGRFGNGHGIETATDAADQLSLEFFLASSILVIILALGWTKPARLSTLPNWRGSIILIPPVLYVCVLLVASILGGGADLGDVLSLPTTQKMILVTVLVGIFEELHFRGAVLQAFETSYGITIAVFVSSLIFGVMHYVNWVDGQPFLGTTFQVIHAAGSGLMYAAIMLVTRSIWFSVAFHALWDCSILLTGAMAADQISETATSASDGGLIQVFLLVGLEPIYGLLVFWWWRRKTKSGADAGHASQ